MHKVYYQPEGIWVGDIMPYGEDGTFYLYHQRDTRNPGPFGEPFGWALATTKDFVNYKDFGESLERGGDEEVDQYVYAGTVFKVGDKYHALYTGCNRDKVKARLMKQVLLHATSDDAVKWEKNIAETLLPPQEGYDDRNWRDPFVLWDEENEEYMLILGTRVGEDKRLMTGRLVKFTSKDLDTWEFQGDWWNPGLYTMFEMPDLFKMGDWWYLVFSEYSDGNKTRYRMSRSINGPWITPADDSFDGRAYYA
ncbi:MAG: family 43 glycosylhydrolase, partial [Collinsella sp.]|nr:family 43 glycosylhydrolase [Collinsella sp.]